MEPGERKLNIKKLSTLHEYYQDYQIKGNEIGRTCRTHGEMVNAYKY